MQKWIVFLAVLLTNITTFAQSDTTFYRSGKIQFIKTPFADKPNDFYLKAYFEDGSPMLEGTFTRVRSSWYANSSLKIFAPDGGIYQEYNHDKGLLKEYRNGFLFSSKEVPLNDTFCIDKSYYTNGTLKSYEYEQHRPGEYILNLTHSSHSPQYYLYQFSHYPREILKNFYPNGKLMYQNNWSPDGTITEEFYREDGSPDTLTESGSRIYREYFPNGQLHTLESKKGKIKDGWFMTWNEAGTLLSKYHWENNELSGECTSYFDDGHLREHYFYKGGRPFGPVIKFHENGNVERSGSELGYNPCGIVCAYNDQGELQWENLRLEYCSITGFYDFRSAKAMGNDTLISQGPFESGFREGKWTATRADQSLIYEANYHQGLLNGELKFYHPNGKPAARAFFKNGWIDGPFKTFKPDGLPIAEGFYKHHQKDSIWKTYYPNGNLQYVQRFSDHRNSEILEQYYENGQVQFIRRIDKESGFPAGFSYRDDGTLYIKTIYPQGGKLGNQYFFRKDGTLERAKLNFPEGGGKKQYLVFNSEGKTERLTEMAGSKFNGAFTAFYPNGKTKISGHYKDDYQDSTWTWYNEKGKITQSKTYKAGVEVRPNPEYDLSACSCYEEGPVLRAHSYLPSFSSLLEKEQVRKFSQLFNPDSSYAAIFMRYLHGNSVQAFLFRNFGFDIEGSGGMKLILNPCRKGSNKSKIDLSWYIRDELEQKTGTPLPDDFDFSPNETFRLMCSIYSYDIDYAYLVKALKNYFTDTVRLKEQLALLLHQSVLLNVDTGFEAYNAYFDSLLMQSQYYEYGLTDSIFTHLIEPEIQVKGMDSVFQSFFIPVYESNERYYDDEYGYEYEPEYDSYLNEGYLGLKEYCKQSIRVYIDLNYFSLLLPNQFKKAGYKKEGGGQRPEALFPVKELIYSNEFNEDILYKPRGKACIPDFSIKNTKSIFSCDSIVALINHNFEEKFHEQIRQSISLFKKEHNRKFYYGIYSPIGFIRLKKSRKSPLAYSMLYFEGNFLCGEIRKVDNPDIQLEKIASELNKQGFLLNTDSKGEKITFYIDIKKD